MSVGVSARTYGHVAVSTGVNETLRHKSEDAKAAWLKVMRGRGREVFHGPYGQG